MTELSELVVRITANSSSLDRELKKAKVSVAGATKEMGSSVGLLASQFRALLPALSVGAFVAFAKSALSAADRLNDLSQRTGVAASTLSALNIPLLQGGASVEEFASSINRMNNMIGEAAKGASQDLIDTFDHLGLSIKALQQLTPEQQFNEIARALNGIKSQADFTNTGMAIFGRSFSVLAPLIRESNGEIGALVDNLKATGNALTDAELKRIDEWGDAWTSAIEHAKLGLVDMLDLMGRILATAPTTNSFFTAKTGLTSGSAASYGPNYPRGEVSSERPETVNVATFIKNAAGKNAPAKNTKAKTDELKEYNKQLQRQLELSSLTAREQVSLEAKFKTMDAAKANGVKVTDQMIKANQDLAVRAYDAKEALNAQTEAQEKATRASERFAEVLADKLSSGLTDAVFGADSAGDAFRRLGESLARSIFEQSIAQPFASGIVGAIGGAGIGSGIGDFLGGLASFDVGSPYVPNDMVAMVHKGERIVPANQNKPGMGSGGVTIVQNNTFQSGVTRSELAQVLPQVAAAAKNAVFADIQRGGSAAKIVGVR